MRTIYLVRHGLSYANNREHAAFGSPEAELMPRGIEQAHDARAVLLGQYALQTGLPVATSTMTRARQMAQEAGFDTATTYSELDEIDLNLLNITDYAAERARWKAGDLHQSVLEQAQQTLDVAPVEQVWFTHGLRIAGICRLLDQHQDARTIPDFGEVRQITIS